MSLDDIIARASANWQQAKQSADALLRMGHTDHMVQDICQHCLEFTACERVAILLLPQKFSEPPPLDSRPQLDEISLCAGCKEALNEAQRAARHAWERPHPKEVVLDGGE